MSEPSGPAPDRPRRELLPSGVRPADLEPKDLAARILSGDWRTARWVGPVFLGLAVVLAGWTVVLAITLPTRGELRHEDVVWVGFDIGLMFGLASTSWTALRRSRYLPVAAAATGSLLVTDAWFDVVGSGRHDLPMAIVMAVLVELPLSALCWWLALHAQDIAARRVTMLVWGRRAEADGAASVRSST